ncbi:hypothetical protein N7E81_00210 [Reichenbachiella carrageenanivorans]|uniref:Uncharacterized protein n=1 Tax=Reichenbachiella carrageenanivorans TaxID=2979869 RepID=A0ABY6D353_9BACT|nr:hypothetical protein [Reichenbachiella carrageenanivorans]UXX79533.1 hypothetical protein N7E81_00210 [Reichenbachiella carrageenanivorans]
MSTKNWFHFLSPESIFWRRYRVYSSFVNGGDESEKLVDESPKVGDESEKSIHHELIDNCKYVKAFATLSLGAPWSSPHSENSKDHRLAEASRKKVIGKT